MKCTCSMQTLLSAGCKCGAMDKERNKPQSKPVPQFGLVEPAKGEEWWQNGQFSKPPPNENIADWAKKEESLEEWLERITIKGPQDGELLEDYIDRVYNKHWGEFQQTVQDSWDEVGNNPSK